MVAKFPVNIQTFSKQTVWQSAEKNKWKMKIHLKMKEESSHNTHTSGEETENTEGKQLFVQQRRQTKPQSCFSSTS